MSTLDPAVFFEGPSEIGNNDLAKMEVANFSTDVDQALSEHFGWRGKATAAVGLTLSADNLRVDKGEFITRGDLDLKEKKLAANSIWPDARANISLHITFPSANVFTFENGGLWWTWYRRRRLYTPSMTPQKGEAVGLYLTQTKDSKARRTDFASGWSLSCPASQVPPRGSSSGPPSCCSPPPPRHSTIHSRAGTNNIVITISRTRSY